VIGCKRGWIRKSMVVMVVQNIHDKKNDVILICKGVDNYYLWVYHFECISNPSKKKTNKQKTTTTTKTLVI
jgi:hypothetical protein